MQRALRSSRLLPLALLTASLISLALSPGVMALPRAATPGPSPSGIYSASAPALPWLRSRRRRGYSLPEAVRITSMAIARSRCRRGGPTARTETGSSPLTGRMTVSRAGS